MNSWKFDKLRDGVRVNEGKAGEYLIQVYLNLKGQFIAIHWISGRYIETIRYESDCLLDNVIEAESQFLLPGIIG